MNSESIVRAAQVARGDIEQATRIVRGRPRAARGDGFVAGEFLRASEPPGPEMDERIQQAGPLECAEEIQPGRVALSVMLQLVGDRHANEPWFVDQVRRNDDV